MNSKHITASAINEWLTAVSSAQHEPRTQLRSTCIGIPICCFFLFVTKWLWREKWNEWIDIWYRSFDDCCCNAFDGIRFVRISLDSEFRSGSITWAKQWQNNYIALEFVRPTDWLGRLEYLYVLLCVCDTRGNFDSHKMLWQRSSNTTHCQLLMNE